MPRVNYKYSNYCKWVEILGTCSCLSILFKTVLLLVLNYDFKNKMIPLFNAYLSTEYNSY